MHNEQYVRYNYGVRSAHWYNLCVCRKKLIPLPPPFGLWYLGKWYLPLTAFCFAAMSNGVNLTDGLDGLAAGTTAAAYIGMAVAVLPIYPGEYSALD